MTEANLRRSWPSYQSHMYCLHKSGEVCTQFHMEFILLTVQHVQNVMKSQLCTYFCSKRRFYWLQSSMRSIHNS